MTKIFCDACGGEGEEMRADITIKVPVNSITFSTKRRLLDLCDHCTHVLAGIDLAAVIRERTVTELLAPLP